MVSDIHALILELDFGFIVRDMMVSILGHKDTLEAFVDSNT